MTDTAESTLFLATTFAADGTEAERLVSAPSAHAARSHVMHLCKASAADVARVLQAGGKVEQAGK